MRSRKIAGQVFYTDCEEFIGLRPCTAHKERGHTCPTCPFYSEKRSVLIVCAGAYGDVLHHTALFKFFEDYQIDFLTCRKMVPVLEHNQRIANLYTIEDDRLEVIGNLYTHVISVEKDKGFCSFLSNRTEGMSFYFTYDLGEYSIEGAACQRLYDLMERELLLGLDDREMKQNRISRIERMVAMLDMIGIDTSEVPKEDWVKTEVCYKGIAYSWTGKTLGIMAHAGTTIACNRALPVRRYIDLINRMDPSINIVLLGGKSEEHVNRAIQVGLARGVINTTEQRIPSYHELCAYVQACDVILVPDTLVWHIARGLDKPCVRLCSSTSEYDWIKKPNETFIKNKRDCAICYLRHCELDCWKNVKDREILDAVTELFRYWS
jgi:ADP-heptose:LPS heptosyltransferase